MDEQKTLSKFVIPGGMAAVLAIIAYFGVCAGAQHHALTKAESQLKKGFGTLAAETLEPYRAHLVKSADHCKTLVAAYAAARRVDRLEWTSEACLDNGVETLEVYDGLASAEDQLGRDGDALQVLSMAAKKFPKSPDPLINMSKVFQKNKDVNRAVAAVLGAVNVAGNNHQLELEGLQFFAGVNRWTEAKQMADRLKVVDTDNPEVKLLVARALLKGGDKASAKEQVAKAEPLIQKLPQEQQSALKKTYSDVL